MTAIHPCHNMNVAEHVPNLDSFVNLADNLAGCVIDVKAAPTSRAARLSSLMTTLASLADLAPPPDHWGLITVARSYDLDLFQALLYHRNVWEMGGYDHHDHTTMFGHRCLADILGADCFSAQ